MLLRLRFVTLIFLLLFFCGYSVWVICFVLVSPRIAVWRFRHSGVFCAREWVRQ